MSRLTGLIPIMSRIFLDLPYFLARRIHVFNERCGDFNEALDIAKKRLLVSFFETTDFCNARCIMCGSKYMKRARQVMPMEIYCTAVEQVAKAKGHSIMLSGFGELLLDPYIVERVEFASKFPTILNTGFSTYGSLLTPKMYRRLAEAGLRNMAVSIDGFGKESYEKIRVGLSFESLEKNMSRVLKLHEAMGRPITLKVTSFTLESPKKLAESVLYKRFVECGIRPGIKLRVDNWGGLVSKVGSGLWLKSAPWKRGPCALLYDSSILVLPDGRVTPCHCRDLEGELYIGDVMQNSLEDIWSGNLLRKLREEQGRGIFKTPCTRCSAYMPLKLWFTNEMTHWLLEYDRRVPIDDRC